MMPVMLILGAENVLGKTPSGRYIGESMKLRLRNAVNNPNPQDTSYQECLNCGFVMEDPYFAEGCPNCGCKDTKQFESAIVSEAV
jgi:rubrerythrin